VFLIYDQNTIIRDARVLREQFIPSRVLHREGQLDAIRNCLKPILKELEPRNIFIHGPPGTGKTCLAKYVAEELSAHSTSVVGCYINCWECSSRFKVLYSILQDSGPALTAHRKGTPTDELLGTIRKRFDNRYIVVILDEVDKLDDDLVLYDLASLQNSCLILISNSETALFGLDPRIRSRLASAENLEFPLYSEAETLDIIRDRADLGLLPGVIKSLQMERIASSSGGDSRMAIETLRIVAEDAENQDLEVIPDSMIEKALPRAMASSKVRNLEMLPPYQRLILEILETQGTMDSAKLMKGFMDLARKRGLSGVVDRTFRNHVDKLAQLGMVTAQGDGRWRTYSLEGSSGK
jgi:orc1/cdc6 family replication initiation protein